MAEREFSYTYPNGKRTLSPRFWEDVDFPKRSMEDILQSPCTDRALVNRLNTIPGTKLPEDWAWQQMYKYVHSNKQSGCGASFIPVTSQHSLIIHLDDAETIYKAIERLGLQKRAQTKTLLVEKPSEHVETESRSLRRIGALQGQVSQVIRRLSNIEDTVSLIKEYKEGTHDLIARVYKIENWIKKNFPGEGFKEMQQETHDAR